MKLHKMNNTPRLRPVKRIGRGGKRGSYSGRGVKGQKSRAGRRIRPAVRDLLLRIPKRRGFKNKPKSEKPFSVNLNSLEQKYKPLSSNATVEVSRDSLLQTGILPEGFRGKIKILGDGAIGFPITVKGIPVSKSAKIKIEAAGGKII